METLRQRTDQPRVLNNVDWSILGIYFLLVAFGIINIYSSEYNETQSKLFDFSLSHGKQLIWFGASLLFGFIIMMLDFRLYHTIAYLIYAGGILLLLVTLAMGKVINGAQGWLVIGGFQLQTGEIAKLATILALAKYLSSHGTDIRIQRHKIIAFVIILVPCLIVLLQNDTGSALVFFSLVFMLFREGLSSWFIIVPAWTGLLSMAVLVAGKNPVFIGLAIIGVLAFLILRRSRKMVLFLVAAIILSAGVTEAVDFGVNHVLKEYQRERIDVLIGKEVDNKGAGYNVHQSLIAIGSGGVVGKGFLKGTQTKFNFVPEQSTDFIFCTVGEEYGFIGSFLLVIIYVYLMYRIVLVAERQKFTFSRCYAYGVFAVFFFHFTINMGMALGLFPVIGIPLPFLSYGGSSMISFSVMLFILLKLDAANRDY